MRRNMKWLLSLGSAAVVLAAASTLVLVSAMGNQASPNGCAAPSLAGTVVDVTLADSGGSMMGGGPGMGGYGSGGAMRIVTSTTSVPAGRVSFRVANAGGLVHELVVLPLLAGHAPGGRQLGSDSRVNEAGSVGEASRNCGAGAGDGIQPGAKGWMTLVMKPGTYELVCNLPGHYAAGMYTQLIVS